MMRIRSSSSGSGSNGGGGSGGCGGGDNPLIFEFEFCGVVQVFHDRTSKQKLKTRERFGEQKKDLDFGSGTR